MNQIEADNSGIDGSTITLIIMIGVVCVLCVVVIICQERIRMYLGTTSCAPYLKSR